MFLSDVGTADARVSLDLHVVTEGEHDLDDLLCEFSGWSEDQALGFLFGDIDGLEQ